MTIQDCAADASTYLYRSAHRDIILLTEEAPHWMLELCRIAHSSFRQPDDWRFEFIEVVLNALANDDCEGMRPLQDELYGPTERLKWLSSNIRRTAYVDAVIGCGDSIDELLQLAMQWEMDEVYSLVRKSLSDRVGAQTTKQTVLV